MHRPTIDLGERLQGQERFFLEPGETLPCGVRFLDREGNAAPTVLLSVQDCAMLEQVVTATRKLDGGVATDIPRVLQRRILGFDGDTGSCTSDNSGSATSWHRKLLGGPETLQFASPFQADSHFGNTTAEGTPLNLYMQLLFGQRLSVILLLFLPALYGGIHLSAWNAMFGTNAETTLWRCSAILIMAGHPLFCALAFSLGKLMEFRKRDNYLDTGILVFCMWCLLLSYVAARVYIVAEAFISLYAVPIGVYWTPDWVEMLPHL
ncbi:hypothetical protein PG985_002712 [Apiospora marii]|uniref:uncharacterized protein n=1 Tax=Apiospora marii TaxID=335849 RepID=UPI00312E4662